MTSGSREGAGGASLSPGRLTAAVVAAAATYLTSSAALALVARELTDGVPARTGPAAFDVAVGAGAAVLAWCLLTWLAASFAVAVRDAVRAVRDAAPAHGRGWVSSPARRLAAVTVAFAVLGGATPTTAADLTTPTAPTVSTSDAHAGSVAESATQAEAPEVDRPATLDLSGWVPDRPTAPAGGIGLVSSAPRPPGDPVREVVVRRGESLWHIAARALGPGADAGEIAAEWPRWYAANRDLIGPDPDLVVPGQRLRAPTRT